MRHYSMPFSELLPHAPQVGLFVAPGIPGDKLANALGDYAKTIGEADVKALYDATLMGSAKDGAVFTDDRVVFQNNDLQPVHEIRYEDIVQVDARRKLLGGRRVQITVNRGRATFEVEMDFSGKPEAADYVLRFLREAMLRTYEDHGAFEDAGGDRRAASRVRGNTERGNIGRGDAGRGDAERGEGTTDVQAVTMALRNLVNDGRLSSDDFDAMIGALRR